MSEAVHDKSWTMAKSQCSVRLKTKDVRFNKRVSVEIEQSALTFPDPVSQLFYSLEDSIRKIKAWEVYSSERGAVGRFPRGMMHSLIPLSTK